MTKSTTKYKITTNGITHTSDGEDLKQSMEIALQFSAIYAPEYVIDFFASMAYECLHVQGMNQAIYEVNRTKVKIEKI